MKKIMLTFLAVVVAFAMFLGFTPTTTTKAATDYHAYMGIQTNTNLWVFRNKFDDETYGLGTDAFKGLSSVDSKKVVTHYDGTFTDANITGDGTYTVTLDNPDFAGETNMSQLFVSTDIPLSDSLKVTNVIVKIDGKTIYTFDKAMLNPDSTTCALIMCQDIWHKEASNLFLSNLPFTKCEITFTVSGLAKGAAEQEALKDFTFKASKDHVAISGYTGSDTSVKLPSRAYGKDVTEISPNAFENSKIKEVTIPSTVTKIGKYAFASSKLTSITIPKGVTSIADGAFASCSGLQKITVAKGNTSYVVKEGVLFSKDMKTLVQYPVGKTGSAYTIPSSVTKIQACAFEGCTKLTKLTISNKVTTIGKDAFKGCSKLTIYAPSGSTAYDYAVKQGIKVKKG
ncbi:MAG TPA: leucine-rich repeat domain-containing protein [Mobilitalea sp.]|nr:leucine-rich repeat domain-containing protein [Mobilitalea sp.]